MRMHRLHLIKSTTFPHPLLRLLAKRPAKAKGMEEVTRLQNSRLALTSVLDSVSSAKGCVWNRSSEWTKLPPIFLFYLRTACGKELMKHVPSKRLQFIELINSTSTYFVYK